MSTSVLNSYVHLTTEDRRATLDHVLPFLTAVAIFLVSALGSMWLSGLPH